MSLSIRICIAPSSTLNTLYSNTVSLFVPVSGDNPTWRSQSSDVFLLLWVAWCTCKEDQCLMPLPAGYSTQFMKSIHVKYMHPWICHWPFKGLIVLPFWVQRWIRKHQSRWQTRNYYVRRSTFGVGSTSVQVFLSLVNE